MMRRRLKVCLILVFLVVEDLFPDDWKKKKKKKIIFRLNSLFFFFSSSLQVEQVLDVASVVLDGRDRTVDKRLAPLLLHRQHAAGMALAWLKHATVVMDTQVSAFNYFHFNFFFLLLTSFVFFFLFFSLILLCVLPTRRC